MYEGVPREPPKGLKGGPRVPGLVLLQASGNLCAALFITHYETKQCTEEFILSKSEQSKPNKLDERHFNI